LNEEVPLELEKALGKDSKETGLTRNRGDGAVVVEYLKRGRKIRLHVRPARCWIGRWRLRRKYQKLHGLVCIQPNPAAVCPFPSV